MQCSALLITTFERRNLAAVHHLFFPYPIPFIASGRRVGRTATEWISTETSLCTGSTRTIPRSSWPAGARQRPRQPWTGSSETHLCFLLTFMEGPRYYTLAHKLIIVLVIDHKSSNSKPCISYRIRKYIDLCLDID